jgi:hypothetical protein
VGGSGGGGTFSLGSSFLGGNLIAVILISLSISSSSHFGVKSRMEGAATAATKNIAQK